MFSISGDTATGSPVLASSCSLFVRVKSFGAQVSLRLC